MISFSCTLVHFNCASTVLESEQISLHIWWQVRIQLSYPWFPFPVCLLGGAIEFWILPCDDICNGSAKWIQTEVAVNHIITVKAIWPHTTQLIMFTTHKLLGWLFIYTTRPMLLHITRIDTCWRRLIVFISPSQNWCRCHDGLEMKTWDRAGPQAHSQASFLQLFGNIFEGVSISGPPHRPSISKCSAASAGLAWVQSPYLSKNKRLFELLPCRWLGGSSLLFTFFGDRFPGMFLFRGHTPSAVVVEHGHIRCLVPIKSYKCRNKLISKVS